MNQSYSVANLKEVVVKGVHTATKRATADTEGDAEVYAIISLEVPLDILSNVNAAISLMRYTGKSVNIDFESVQAPLPMAQPLAADPRQEVASGAHPFRG